MTEGKLSSSTTLRQPEGAHDCRSHPISHGVNEGGGPRVLPLLHAGEKARGRDEFKSVLQRLRRAFPDIPGVTIYELRDGKIARVWVAADLLSLLRSLTEGRVASPPEARV